MVICQRQRSSFLQYFLIRKSMIEPQSCCVVIKCSPGPPNVPNPAELACPGWNSLRPTLPHQYRLNDSFQRIDLPSADIALHIIFDTNLIHPDTKTSWTASPLWSLQAGSLGPPNQSIRHPLHSLCPYVRRSADNCARHCRQHELRWTACPRPYRSSDSRLGYQWSFQISCSCSPA
jgi:hypothetical protein